MVVVPCLNERAHVGRVVETILEDPDWIDPLVVVVDGGSVDGTVELVERIAARDRRVRLVHNPRRLQSAAVNLAAALFGTDRGWLVRVDAHAEYPPGFVTTLIGEARGAGADSVVVSMRAKGRSCFQRAVAQAQNSWLGAGGAAHRRPGKAGFVEHGHHALFDMARFCSLGGYDESFTHNEDAEFDARLRRGGGRIWLTRAVQIGYFPRERPRALLAQYFRYGRGRARTLWLHRQRPAPRQLAPALVAPALALLAAAPAWPAAAAPAAAWAIVCCGMGLALALARRSRCALLCGPAAMIMHAGWSFGFWTETATSWRARPAAAAPQPLAYRR